MRMEDEKRIASLNLGMLPEKKTSILEKKTSIFYKTMLKTQKYRIYPTKAQIILLTIILELCRFLYNCARRGRIEAYKHGVSISRIDQQKELTECRAIFPELRSIHRTVLVDVLFRLERAFQNFFRRVKNGEKPGFPRHKSRNRYHSITYPSANDPLNKDGKLELAKIGFVKIVMSRPLPDNDHIRSLTIKREGKKWYACFVIEVDTPPLVELTSESKVVGIDVGINSFATLSTGEKIYNQKWYKKALVALKGEDRSLSRKKKGSKNRKKQQEVIAKKHEKIANQRKDFHHKLSRKIVDEFDLIAHEELDIENMKQDHRYAQSISDAGWGTFLGYINYKAEEAGKLSVSVKASGTSIECSKCGFPVYKTIEDRIHTCHNCGLVIDRDWNSALVILGRALPQELGSVEIENGLRVHSRSKQGVCVQNES